MSGGGSGDTVLDSAANIVTMGAHKGSSSSLVDDLFLGQGDKVKAGVDMATGETARQAKKMEQEAEEAAKRQREYELKQLETQKKNRQAIKDATKQRNSKSSVQSQRRQSASLTTNGLGSSSTGDGGSKNLLGL